jgi:hypothetical protein
VDGNSRIRQESPGSRSEIWNIFTSQPVLDSDPAGTILSTYSVGFIEYPGVWPARRCSLASLDPSRPEDFDTLVAELRRLLAGMQHGSVTLIVQDGRVVQLDATHKVRLAGASTERPGKRP